MGPGDGDLPLPHGESTKETAAPDEEEESGIANLLLSLQALDGRQDKPESPPQVEKKKKKRKEWRDDRAETYEWAHVGDCDGRTRVFCSICQEFGIKDERNPYGNRGSTNMRLDALANHSKSLLHLEALEEKEKLEIEIAPANESSVCVNDPISEIAASILDSVLRRDPHEVEYIQSAKQFICSLQVVLESDSKYIRILRRLLEPERTLIFSVPWIDDKGVEHVNRGFRVQFSQAMGPCRGPLRFHPSMNLSIAKFLGLEQTLKSALSPCMVGGAAGGSDFDAKGRSDNEIMHFCQSFMKELSHYLGPDKYLPAEDIGVGPRELGYLYRQYEHLAGCFQGNFKGPKNLLGHSYRTKATACGLVHLACLMLEVMNKGTKGIRCVITGSGKIALEVLQQLLYCHAVPITVSDSNGYLLDDDGFDKEKLLLLWNIKCQRRSLRDYLQSYGRAKYIEGATPWGEKYEVAFPCASHNEINNIEAHRIVNSTCCLLVEGSFMPCTPGAVEILTKAEIPVAPAKVGGVGGVALEELRLDDEQNLMQLSVEDFQGRIKKIIKETYNRLLAAAMKYGHPRKSPDALVHGANISAFLSVAQAMIDQGRVKE